nr:PREDICTED: regulator of nonsense transcripts 2 [Bemisia tabaci]
MESDKKSIGTEESPQVADAGEGAICQESSKTESEVDSTVKEEPPKIESGENTVEDTSTFKSDKTSVDCIDTLKNESDDQKVECQETPPEICRVDSSNIQEFCRDELENKEIDNNINSNATSDHKNEVGEETQENQCDEMLADGEETSKNGSSDATVESLNPPESEIDVKLMGNNKSLVNESSEKLEGNKETLHQNLNDKIIENQKTPKNKSLEKVSKDETPQSGSDGKMKDSKKTVKSQCNGKTPHKCVSSDSSSTNVLAEFIQRFELSNSSKKSISKTEVEDTITDSGRSTSTGCSKSPSMVKTLPSLNNDPIKSQESKADCKSERPQTEGLKNSEDCPAVSVEQAEKNEVLTFITETKQRIQAKLEIRMRNKNAIRLDEQSLAKLDSSLKKNTAFVKKVRNFTAAQLGSLLKEMQTLNLSKYLSEIAAALIETKLKMSDISAAVLLCTEINCRYAEFGKCMLECWQKTLAQKRDEKVVNLSKFRVDLRFYADLISSGVFSCKEALPLLGNVLTVLTTSSREDSSHISIILSFCKYCGEDYAGLVPRRVHLLAEKYSLEIPKSDLIPPEKQKTVRMLLKDYHANLQKHLLKEHSEFQRIECQNQKILQTKGELSNEKKEKSEMLNSNLQKLLVSVSSLAELVDEEAVVLPENKQTTTESTCMVAPVNKTDGVFKCSSIWEDEETQKFYEDYPDITGLVPASQKKLRESSKSETEVPEPKLDDIKIEDESDDLKLDEKKEEDSEDTEPISTNFKVLVDSLITGLTTCVNREMVDRIAAEFVLQLGVPNKHVRRKIVKTLFMVPRTRLDLLPLYARFVAVLNHIAPEITADLTYQLKQEFKYHVRKKDQINIESKVKTVRFIGELVKFGLYPKEEGLYCIKVLVHDFTHHNIEMACNLLETCGRFFFRCPETHQRTKVYLEQMMRKKSAMSLDARYKNMVENVYFFVNPPDNPIKRKRRPPLQEYIKQLIYQDLSLKTEEFVLEQLRKLPWDNREIAQYAILCLASAWKVKYLNIRCLANLIAGLVDYQEFIGTEVVDNVLEDIRIGLELNLPKLNQRRLAMIKYLGELYNYRLLESSDVFKVLYSLISFGVSFDPKIISPLDPPENLFRIKLVCILLETCGQFFNHGMPKTKLDYFFIFFQNYYWHKYSHPIWTEQSKFPVNLTYMFEDTLLNLRPNFKMASSLEEAIEASQTLQTKLMSKLPPSLLQISNNSKSGLGTIVETGENSGNESVDEDGDSDNEDGPPVRYEYEEHAPSSECITVEQSLNGHEETINPSEDPDDDEDEEEEDVVDDDYDYDSDSEEMKDFNQEPEDADFLSAFEQMVSDNLQDRMNEVVKPPKVDIAIPLHFKSSTKKTYEQLMQNEEKDENTVNFVLMLRKGSKSQCKTLNVPGNSELAVKLKSQEKAERIEMERVKQLTLNINNRLEEEDYQDQVLQNSRSSVSNFNRDRKQRYQHPKGAPDADAIFGRKKFR